MIPRQKEKTIPELRKFGFVMTGAFALLGGLLLWRGKPLGPYLSVLAVAFLVCALLAPAALRSVEKYWMLIGEKIGGVMTLVIMTLVFFLAVTPLGLLMRLLGKDILSIKLDRDAKSYWEPVAKDGPGSRPYSPF